MTPVEASKEKNQGLLYFNLCGDMETSKQKPKFKVGNKVRIRKTFDEGYTQNWSEEIFIVDKIQYTNSIYDFISWIPIKDLVNLILIMTMKKMIMITNLNWIKKE